MLRIPYRASGFPPQDYPWLSQHGEHSLWWAGLGWAAITVGKPSIEELFAHGRFSGFEVVRRLAILYANLRQDHLGYIRRSNLYLDSDPSEKSGVSYFLGLAVAKLFCEQCFNTPWLAHLDVYGDMIGAVWRKRRSRPDLIGLTRHGEWVVWEAKGRSGRRDDQALDSAKSQTSAVLSVSGATPNLRAASVAHFNKDRLGVDLADPPHSAPDAQPLPLSQGEFLARYYRPFRRLLANLGKTEKLFSREIGGHKFDAVEIPGTDVTVGVSRLIRESSWEAKDFEGEFPKKLSLSLPRPEKALDEGFTMIGADGVLVTLSGSWTESKMKLEALSRPEAVPR